MSLAIDDGSDMNFIVHAPLEEEATVAKLDQLLSGISS
jgi:hypothetical protein